MRLALVLLIAGCHHEAPYPPVDTGGTVYTPGQVDSVVATPCGESVVCGDCYAGASSCSVIDCNGSVTSTYTAECDCPTSDSCDGCADDGTELCHVLDCNGYEVDSYFTGC